MKVIFLVYIVFIFCNSGFSQFQCGNNFTDPRDGKIYPTVSIGTQCWFAKNLNFGTFTQSTSTGTPHSNVSNNSVIQKYCYNNIEDSCASLGGLYEWDEMMNYTIIEKVQGVCPDGWHIPGDEEWKTLEMELGMTQVDADAIGQRGTNQGTQLLATGTSGFDALFYGYRYAYGQFAGHLSEGYFWTSTVNSVDATKAYYRALRNSHSMVERASDIQILGFSVRCLYGQGMDVEELKEKTYYISDPFPNPSSSFCKIEYELFNNISEGYIIIYNILGAEVKKVQIYSANTSVTIDISDLNSGEYFFKLFYDGKYSSAKSLQIQK